jgi:hypothetical protein
LDQFFSGTSRVVCAIDIRGRRESRKPARTTYFEEII